MISEYKQQFREPGRLLDRWTKIPVNKKEALHNKFKGRGNYAILDDLVGGSGNILKRYNAFCKENGMPCYVKCCSNNEDCSNTCCTSDGRRDDARFSTYECVYDTSHDLIDKCKQMPPPPPPPLQSALSPPPPSPPYPLAHDAGIDGRGDIACGDGSAVCAAGGGLGVDENGDGGCGDGADACGGVITYGRDAKRCSCACSIDRRYKCACSEPSPWCALCSQTKKCQLDEVDADWRGICQEVFVFDEKVGLSIRTKLKGLLSRMENLETVWLCGNCKQHLMSRMDVLKRNCPCPFPEEPCQDFAGSCCQAAPPCNLPTPCGCNTQTPSPHSQYPLAANCGCDSNCPSTSSTMMRDHIPIASSSPSSKSKKTDEGVDDAQVVGGKEAKSVNRKESKPSHRRSHKSSHNINEKRESRTETQVIITEEMRKPSTRLDSTRSSSNKNQNATERKTPFSSLSAVASPRASKLTSTAAATAGASAAATSAVKASSKRTSVTPKTRDGATQINSNMFLDCRDCKCCR